MAKKPTKYTVSDGKLVLTLEVAEEGGVHRDLGVQPRYFDPGRQSR
jgi:hypothetical protein